MSNPYQIPYAALDNFYFEQFIPRLHPVLRSMATDLRILRHAHSEAHISSVEKLYKVHVGFIPWLLDDIFALTENQILHLGQGWLLTFIDIAMTDSLVDDELPHLNLLPLLQQEIRLCAEEEYRRLFPHSLQFWTAYGEAYLAGLNALAHEAYCTDLHQIPYSFEELEKVYQGKGAIYRVMVKAMAELSGQESIRADLELIYHNLAVVDQLLDDASDWESDFERGHLTVPIVLALEAAGIPLADFSLVDKQSLQGHIYYNDILMRIAEKAIDLLKIAKSILATHEIFETKLSRFLEKRLASVEKRKNQFKSLRILKLLMLSSGQ